MSVGTSFENSALKSSFSLSSLGGSTLSPNNGRHKQSVERPYHSLTKKRKDPNRELWRRSWGSTHSGGSQISVGMMLSSGDDLWSALQQNYDYIMDNQIIDSCKEVNGELLENSTPVIPVSSSIYVSPSSGFNRQWSLNQLIVEFTDMCQWLTAIQEEIYSSPENLSNRMLRLSKMSEITSSEGRLGKFCEQASAIADRIPEARGEVGWRVRHLQLKWESVTQALSPDARDTGEENGNVVDSEHEMKCLRRWLHVMEGRLPPPSLAAARCWTPQELMRKVHEHQVLQREVQCAGRAVGSVRRACGGGAALERRWHLLCLRALEWQCHLEACVARLEDQNAVEQSDSEEEPALKQPRLARRRDRYLVHAQANSSEDDLDDETYPSLESYPCKSGSEQELDDESAMESTDEGTPVNNGQHEGTPVNDCQYVPGSHEGTPVNQCPSMTVELFSHEGDGNGDCVDGIHEDSSQDITMYDDDTQASKTPPTVIKRQKKHIDSSRFNQSNRKSKNCATFYFKHHDTDSDRQVKSGLETDEKSQEESSEEEWTYTRQTDETITDVMTSSVEIQCGFSMDIETPIKSSPVENNINENDLNIIECNETKTTSQTPDLLKLREPTVCSKENINRLVSQAEALVQKQSVQTSVMQKKGKLSRSFKPLNFEESKIREKEGGTSQNKMSRIKEWLRQHSSDQRSELTVQCNDNYDASGEYTTGESEAERQSEASEEVAPSTHAPSTLTPTSLTPTHNKVTLRKKRNNNGTRPWSVSCLSQLSYACASRGPTTVSGSSLHERTPDEGPGPACRQPGMSISESALHTLSHAHTLARAHSRNKMHAGSTSSVKTTVQGNISSSTTINEGSCASCFENADPKQCSMRRKRLKLRRRQQEHLRQSHDGESNVLVRRTTPRRADRFVKSLSFSGHLTPQMEDKHDRSAASDPSCSRKTRFDTTSTSGNDSEDELLKQQLMNIASLRRSIERTHISSTTEAEPIKEQEPEQELEPEAAPSFKLGPGGGGVRPRTGYPEPALGRTLVEQAANWDLGCGDRDSDVDRSIHTVGTEEHSSFSEQAWDFYQEKYNSENYSEAPDSDAARRLLEFGDDYRNFLDSQSDCCSSLSAQQREPSPARRPRPAPRRSPALADQEGVRRRKLISEGSERKNKRGSTPHITDATAHLNTRTTNTPDIVDCANRRTRRPSNTESNKSVTRDLDAFRITNSIGGVVSDSSQRRRLFSRDSGEDSWERAAEEAGMAEVRGLVARSGSQLALAEAMFAKQESSPDLLRSSDYNDILATCRDNIHCLEAVLAGAAGGGSAGRGGLLSPAQCREIRGLAARWCTLRAGAARRGGARRLRREVAALRAVVLAPDQPATAPHTRAHLHRRIDQLKDRLSSLLENKVSMLKLNVSAQRLVADASPESAGGGEGAEVTEAVVRALRDEVAELYRAWEDAHQRTSSELISLEGVLEAWSSWESGLKELQGALKGDQATLRLIESALLAGQIEQVAPHVRDVAKLLSEKTHQTGSVCGSVSDSGISDSGSERGASERERRLAALRAAARTLQASLAPGSRALQAMAERMEAAESELRALQGTCRSLLQRTGGAETSGGPGADVSSMLHTQKISEDASVLSEQKTSPGDPEVDPSGRSSRSKWAWRVMKSALPFQLCLLAFLCAAYLLDHPRCCEAVNNLSMSFTPQLRYVRGPPPV